MSIVYVPDTLHTYMISFNFCHGYIIVTHILPPTKKKKKDSQRSEGLVNALSMVTMSNKDRVKTLYWLIEKHMLCVHLFTLLLQNW